MTGPELFKEYEAWKNEKLRGIDAERSKATKEFATADGALTKAFCAYDVDRQNKQKENVWILALNKRNALAKRLDAIQRAHEELQLEYSYKRFLEETGRE